MISRFFKQITLLLAVIMLVSVTAYAVDDIDTAKECNLIIKAECDYVPVGGVSYSVYRVADVSGSTPDFTAVAPFDGYPIALSGLTLKEWNALALTLKSYVVSDKLMPSAVGTTGADGIFAVGHLTPGLYLVIGERTDFGSDGWYQPSPFLVCLPGYDHDSGSWIYDVTSVPKYTSGRIYIPAPQAPDTPPPPPPTVTVTVLKEWDDELSTADRPTELTYHLYCDGEEYATAVGTEAEGYRVVFEDLPDGHDWTVKEEVPEFYTVELMRSGNKFKFINKLIPPADDNPEEDEIIDTYSVDEPLSPPPSTPSDEVLPQLGLLWWPVPALVCAGLLFLLLSLILKRKLPRE